MSKVSEGVNLSGMSSIERKGENLELVRQRDQYEARLREREAQAKAGFTELRRQHSEEIKAQKDLSQGRYERLQREMSEKLNEKDESHRREIEELKALHQRRLLEAK